MNPHLLRRRLLASALGRAFLWLLSLPYGLAVRLRNLLYNWGILASQRLPARTVCIGNLTAGGTGKTSAVLLAATTLQKRDIKAAILSRGYRRPKSRKKVLVLLETHNIPWQEAGDEPWMMHQALKGLQVPILISPNRYRAGRKAVTYYTPDVVLLDDGFQHRQLRRDLDIVLINALDPFGGGHLLPLGTLREPLGALKRAGMALITHADLVDEDRLSELRRAIEEAAPGLPLAEAVHRPDFLLDLKKEQKRRLSHVKDQKVACLSGIGDPQSFESILRKLGAEVVQLWRFPDHHPYTEEELRSIENARNGIPLITTFKDFPRLPKGWQEILSGEVLALGVRMEITKGKALWESALCDGRVVAGD